LASLAGLTEIIGFFCYSCEDDEAFRGHLSALRDAISRELSAQLGRTRNNFRLFQDKEAIAKSVFFIPLITPRSLNSPYCGHEFEAFLAREAELGRNDLIFPVLYLPVPQLEEEAIWRGDPVLSVIGKRQYVDWRPFRHTPMDTPAAGAAVEQFCSKIAAALRRHWVSPEERRREDEARAAGERQRLEHERAQAEADPRAADEAKRRAAQEDVAEQQADAMAPASSVRAGGDPEATSRCGRPDLFRWSSSASP
jgi:hypothetical protein